MADRGSTRHRRIAFTAGVVTLAVAFAVVVWARGWLPAPLRFTAERIVLRPDGDRLRVTGVYTYENPWPITVSVTLRYPFPLDDDHPWPTSILVQEADRSGHGIGPLPTDRRSDAVDFPVVVPGRSSCRIRVDYTQACPDRTGTYIVTTTRHWGRPVGRAEFVVIVRDTDQLVSMDPPPDTTERRNGKTYCTVTRTDFWPDREIEIAWRAQGEGGNDHEGTKDTKADGHETAGRRGE